MLAMTEERFDSPKYVQAKVKSTAQGYVPECNENDDNGWSIELLTKILVLHSMNLGYLMLMIIANGANFAIKKD